jgi:4-hydroxy-tetrahydrodipicolinate reductase
MIVLSGNGKLANSLLNGLKDTFDIIKLEDALENKTKKTIVIHAGSGRQLEDCISYCCRTKSTLVELSTGSNIKKRKTTFPVIICPNAAIAILKWLKIIKENGSLFSEYDINIIESHQESKTTVAGTAVEISKALQVSETKIESIRNKELQRKLGINENDLDLHAYHKIQISDIGCEVKIEMKVLGHLAYVNGIKKIINRLNQLELENRLYDVLELM